MRVRFMLVSAFTAISFLLLAATKMFWKKFQEISQLIAESSKSA